MQTKQEVANDNLDTKNEEVAVKCDTAHVTLVRHDTFHWPQHSFKLEQIRAKSGKINHEIEMKLKDLDLYKEEATTQGMEVKVLNAARNCARSIRRRVFIRFDIFMERERPGLGLEEGREESGRKKKRNRRSKSGQKSTTERRVEMNKSFIRFIKPEDGCHLARAV